MSVQVEAVPNSSICAMLLQGEKAGALDILKTHEDAVWPVNWLVTLMFSMKLEFPVSSCDCRPSGTLSSTVAVKFAVAAAAIWSISAATLPPAICESSLA